MSGEPPRSEREMSSKPRPRKERMRSLPTRPGTTIHYVNPDTVVVVEQKAGTGGGGAELKPKIRVCKCLQTQFICTKEGDITVCREQCIFWQCEDIEGGLA